MNIEPVEMTTPTNVEMLKELSHALEALNAERTVGPIHNPQNAAATNAVMRSIECFCSPMIRAVQSPENVKEHATPLAGAGVETGVEVHTTGDVADKAASGGCVSRLVVPSSFSSEDAAITKRNAERLGVDPDEFMGLVEKAARVAEVTSEEAEACNQSPLQSP